MTAQAAAKKRVRLPVKGTENYAKAWAYLGMLNAERKKRGLSSLKMTEPLLPVGMRRARDQLIVFGHTAPTGISALDLIPVSQNGNWAVGENCAIGPTTAKGALSSWMNSAAHRKNMLDARWRSTGIGCFAYKAMDGTTQYCWVQVFSSEEGTRAEKPDNRAGLFHIVAVPSSCGLQFSFVDWRGKPVKSLSLKVGQTRRLYVRAWSDSSVYRKLTLPASSVQLKAAGGLVRVEGSAVTGMKRGRATLSALFANGQSKSVSLKVK
ncbi:MAG: CAP domain-containing protein [Clostridiales Family XIII bacterium]|nr:CAP domain-containing protein [Clostridiales Family XIII bacterium]